MFEDPFEQESWDLYSLDRKDVTHPSGTEMIVTHLERGRLSP